MNLKLRNRTTALALAISLPIASNIVPAATAHENTPSQETADVAEVGVKDADLTADEKQLAKELTPQIEMLFEGGMSENESGQYVFDYEKAKKNLGEEQANEIQAEILRMTAAEKRARPDTSTRALNDYTKCVLEKSGYGGLVGLFSGAYKELIEKKLWSEVAKVIVKQVGKSAVKGGVVGLAAALTVSAGWCKFAE